MRRTASILGTLAAWATVSCAHQSTTPPPTVAADLRWPYVPASVRVHPLSRVVPSADKVTPPRAEVCVQCLDLDGDPTRTIGTLRVQVGADESGGAIERDLGDRTANRADWDPVTRTYRLMLPVPADFACGTGATLPVRVRLMLAPDCELKADGTVGCP